MIKLYKPSVSKQKMSNINYSNLYIFLSIVLSLKILEFYLMQKMTHCQILYFSPLYLSFFQQRSYSIFYFVCPPSPSVHNAMGEMRQQNILNTGFEILSFQISFLMSFFHFLFMTTEHLFYLHCLFVNPCFFWFFAFMDVVIFVIFCPLQRIFLIWLVLCL